VEQSVRELLGTIVLSELGLMVALLLAWRVTAWLLGPRGVPRAVAACPNCGWRRVAAAQVCPACHLAPEDSRFVPPAPRERRSTVTR
jgi:hypothetical protein